MLIAIRSPVNEPGPPADGDRRDPIPSAGRADRVVDHPEQRPAGHRAAIGTGAGGSREDEIVTVRDGDGGDRSRAVEAEDHSLIRCRSIVISRASPPACVSMTVAAGAAIAVAAGSGHSTNAIASAVR